MNNKADGNESRGGALFVRSGNVSLEHSLLFGNQAYTGNALYFAGDFMRVTHCTFANVGVSTKALADIRVDQKGLCIDNSIIYSEGPFTIKESSVAANPSVFGCVIFPSPLAYAEKCVVADPLFVNQSMMDFRISSKSPCIDSAVHGEFPYYAFLNGKSLKSTFGGDSDIRRFSGGDLHDIGAFDYSKDDPGFFLNSDENGKVMSKKNAETFQKLFDTVDNFMKSGKMDGKPFEIPAELRKSVSDSLRVNE